MNIYQEELMDHYRHPRNKKSIEDPDFSAQITNLSCGDTLLIEGKIDGQIIIALGFTGKGCIISQAASSMLTEFCIGKTLDEVFALTQEDIISLLKIPLGPVRLKCAVLALQSLHKGIREYSSHEYQNKQESA